MNEINDNKKAMSEDVKQALIRFNKDNIYVQNLKIELADMSLGYVKGKMMVTEDVLNPYGSVHGGCLYSLADIVSGIAACTYGKFSSTIDGTMTYIAPAMNTEYLICEGMEIDLGANSFQTFVKVTLPLTVPGIVSGIVMVFLPSMTNYVVLDMLYNSTYIMGSLIGSYFSAYNWNGGSMIALVLLVIILVFTLVTNKYTDDDSGSRGGALL